MVANFEKQVTINYLKELKRELEDCGKDIWGETGLWYMEQARKVGEAIELVEVTELEPK